MKPSRLETPPSFASWLLRAVTPEDDRDDVLDELTDEYVRERLARGDAAARSWYRQQVLRSLFPILLRRFTLTSRSRYRVSMRHRLEAVLYDLSYALRQLRRMPAFTATVVATFALGIGMNATMFGIVDEMLLRPPAHVRAPDEIITLKAGSAARGFRQVTLNYPTFVAVRDKASGFSQVAATDDINVPLDRGDRATTLSGTLVTAGYFDLLGVKPERGRFIRADEDVVPLGAAVVVISHRFWMNHFAGADSAIGSKLQLGDRVFTVVGVAPQGFTSLDFAAPDVWIPMSSAGAMHFMGRDWATQATGTWLRIYARMKPNVPPDRAADDAMRVAREAAPAAFFTRPGSEFLAQPVMVARAEAQGASRRVTLLLGVMSLVVLLIACSNVANLLLARGLRRQREIAVRLALGVGRARLIGQSIVESVVLSTLGGVAALLVATWAGALVRAAIFGDIARPDAVIDPRVLGLADESPRRREDDCVGQPRHRRTPRTDA
jgi:putative ABC transport system permease protein